MKNNWSNSIVRETDDKSYRRAGKRNCSAASARECKGIRLEQKMKNIYVIEIEKNANENVIVEIEETTGAFIGTSQIQKVITEEQAKEVALQKVQGGFIEKVSIVDINGTATYQIIIKNKQKRLM